MQRTKIEWVVNPDGTRGYTWNPMHGCRMGCWYCYARRMAERFGGAGAFAPRFYAERLGEPERVRKDAAIFAGSMADLFAPWWQAWQVRAVLDIMAKTERHIYLALTRWPQRLLELCERQEIELPSNLWVGVTITCAEEAERSAVLAQLPTRQRFISFEPLLERIPSESIVHPEWLIFGALTGPKARQYVPRYDWAAELLRGYQGAVFVKDNMVALWPQGTARRETPYLWNRPKI